MNQYGENKNIAFMMAEESQRMAKKYPWWRLIYLWVVDRPKYRMAVKARLYGETEVKRSRR